MSGAPVNPLASSPAEAVPADQYLRGLSGPGVGTRTRAAETGVAHCSVLRVRALRPHLRARALRKGRTSARADLDLENSIASASIYSQVRKGLRWMPWRQEPMKDA
jgi:hypothetical protein